MTLSVYHSRLSVDNCSGAHNRRCPAAFFTPATLSADASYIPLLRAAAAIEASNSRYLKHASVNHGSQITFPAHPVFAGGPLPCEQRRMEYDDALPYLRQ